MFGIWDIWLWVQIAFLITYYYAGYQAQTCAVGVYGWVQSESILIAKVDITIGTVASIGMIARRILKVVGLCMPFKFSCIWNVHYVEALSYWYIIELNLPLTLFT